MHQIQERRRATVEPQQRAQMDSSSFAGTRHRRIAIVVGALFMLQIVVFAIGSSLITTYLNGDEAKSTLWLGVLLEMCSGLAIVAIGLMLYKILRVVEPRWALGYPVMRLTEFTVSAVLAVYLLTQLEQFPNHLLWVYLPTGVGGLILNYLFYVSGLVPRSVAILGIIGYGLLTLTVPLDLLGVIDVESGAGLLMLGPGGVYELLALPLWLFAKGFRAPYLSWQRTATAPAA